jgi:hypothetical protein
MLLYIAKILFKIEEIKIFQDKQKLKESMNTMPSEQKLLKRILHTKEDKHNQKQ